MPELPKTIAALTTPPPAARRHRGSIRNKVSAYVLIASVVPLLAMSAVMVFLTNAAAERNAEAMLRQLMKEKEAGTGEFFGAVTESLDIIVADIQDPKICASASIACAAGEQRAAECADLSLKCGASQQPLDSFLTIGDAQTKQFLQNALASNRAIDEVMVFDLATDEWRGRGKVVGYESNVRQVRDEEIFDRSDFVARDFRINISKLPYYEIVQGGNRYVSPIRQTLDGLLVTVAAPIRNTKGTIIAGIVAEVNLRQIVRLVTLASLGEQGRVMLADLSGNVYASSRQEKIESSLAASSTPFATAAQGSSKVPVVSMRAYAGSVGDIVVGAAIRLETLPLVLVAEWPRQDAYALAREIQDQALVFSFAVLVAALVVSIMIAHRITRPIKLLRQEAQIIGEGRFEEIIDIHTGDELEELDDALHDMSRALKTLEELRNQFVFIAAHELRSPVTAIKGYISMVLEEGESLGQDARHMLEQVQKANQHLVQLVQDLLQVARSEAGRLKVDMAAQDISAIIQAALEDLKPLWQERKLAVSYTPPFPIPQVLADAEKLREVIVNLISNAIKYNRDGGSLTITLETMQDGATATHIADTGIGMTVEETGKLFSKFYRAENEDTRKVQGTGLGLFIVKEIVEKMDGKIWVTSERGKGSTFSFSLKTA